MRDAVELRALRRELLLTRAAAERAQLSAGIDVLAERTRGLQTLSAWVGAASQFGARRRSVGGGLIGLVNAGVSAARSHPWMMSAAVTVGTRLLRSRTVRLSLVAVAVAGALWWLQSTRNRRRAPADLGTDDLIG